MLAQSLHGLVPPYLSDDRQLVMDMGRRHLRSSAFYMCRPAEQSQTGDRSFSVAGPQLWNNLPTEIRRRGTTFEHYRHLLTAFLFVYTAVHCDFYLSAPNISILTHSLTDCGATVTSVQFIQHTRCIQTELIYESVREKPERLLITMLV